MSERAGVRPSSEKMKYVEVKIKVPKPVVDYVRALAMFASVDINKILTDLVVTNVNCLVDEGGYPYTERMKIIKHYGLKEILDC